MREYGFSLTLILPYIDKIINFVLIRENTRQWKPVLSHILCSITYLLPKSNERNIPKNHRPITCLSTIYRIITWIVTERTYNFFDANNILPSEQKEYKKGSYGCKYKLMINKMLLENSRSCYRNLITPWIGYRKAFDSVPHTWILDVFQMFKIFPTIINF